MTKSDQEADLAGGPVPMVGESRPFFPETEKIPCGHDTRRAGSVRSARPPARAGLTELARSRCPLDRLTAVRATSILDREEARRLAGTLRRAEPEGSGLARVLDRYVPEAP
jgi:hypothetical protein